MFDLYFRPISAPGVFHVTAPDGTFRAEGRITDEGADCPILRAEDGSRYALAGDVAGLAPGDRIRVAGRIPETSSCLQGSTIVVTAVERKRSGG